MQRLLLGIALGVVAIAVVLTSVALSRNDTSNASAIGPTPDKIDDGGPLSGLIDMLVNTDADPNAGVGLFYCIGKLDHQVNGTVTDTTPDNVKVAVQCNATVPGFGETGEVPPSVCATTGACNPSEITAFPASGPPPPPPFGSGKPRKGYGFYYHNGIDPDGLCNAPSFPDMASGAEATFIGNLPTGTPCTVLTTCLEDIGAPLGAGPNLIQVEVTYTNATTSPNSSPSIGYTLKAANQTNAACKASQSGDPNVVKYLAGARLPLYLHTWAVADKGGSLGASSPWRIANAVSTLNYDGDECTDIEELDKSGPKCGDDPQNPSDSFAPGSDLSGIYDITMRARPGQGITGFEFARADCGWSFDAGGFPLAPNFTPCSDPAGWVPGTYFFCRADLQHDTGDNSVVLRPYCYIDSPSVPVNVDGYGPGITGDGFAGGPPPGPSNAYGDVDIKHSALSGTYNPSTNAFEIAGCFFDHDGTGGIGHAYITATVSAHQLGLEFGTVQIWANQDGDDCLAGNPVDTVPGVTHMPWAFDIAVWQPNPLKGADYDQDGDGISTARELQDDAACGLRDPYNGNDYYDTSIPRDGVIDLANDILGVILEFTPGGYSGNGGVDHTGDTFKVNYDRPSVMSGGVGSWNRGTPDGVIDLPNDILGVILQFNPFGC